MKFVYLFLFTPVILTSCASTTEVNSNKTTHESVILDPFYHEYYWESFKVAPDSPMSPDKRFQLKKVRSNGWVELIYWIVPNDSRYSRVIIAKRPTEKYEDDSGNLIFAIESDSKTQTATLKVLRMR